MSTFLLYIGSAVSFGLGALLMRKTSPFSRVGGTKFERRMKRKILGEILMVAAFLLLGLGLASQFSSSLQ